jgi:hypothetical protein
VTNAPIAAVVGLAIEPVELAHAARQRGFRRLEEKMVMVAHEDVSVKAPPKQLDSASDDAQEGLPIRIVPHDLSPLIAAARNVPDGSGILEAERTTHDKSILEN